MEGFRDRCRPCILVLAPAHLVFPLFAASLEPMQTCAATYSGQQGRARRKGESSTVLLHILALRVTGPLAGEIMHGQKFCHRSRPHGESCPVRSATGLLKARTFTYTPTMQRSRQSPALQHRGVEPHLGVIVTCADHTDERFTRSFSLVSDMEVPPAQCPLHCCPLAPCTNRKAFYDGAAASILLSRTCSMDDTLSAKACASKIS